MVWSHFLPQFYIRNFGLNDKQTARLDKKTGEKKIVPIKSFCAEKDFFSFSKESLINLPGYLHWIDKDVIERELGSAIEGPVASIITNIQKEQTLSAISENELLILLEWAAWIFIANPTSIAIRSIEDITNEYKHFDYSKVSNEERLKTFVDLHEKITPIFQKRGWTLQVINSNHGHLLSCDHPVMLAGKSLKETAHLSSQTILIPLSPRLLLIGNNNPIWGYSNKPLTSTREAVLISNILALHQSHRFVFGADLNDINNLFKNINSEIKT